MLHFVSCWIVATLGVATFLVSPVAAQTPLTAAHAHNDYLHERPLLDALDQGFCNVEADVFLVNGQLLVGHTRFELRTGRTLEALYLDPLKERIEANNGQVFETPAPLTLLIDFKTNGEATYAALEKLLAQYDFISVTKDGQHEAKAVTVIVSGNRPMRAIAESNPRYVRIDGRISHLGSALPADMMPLISDKWGSHFAWKGQGAMPPDQKAKLQEFADKTHAKGRRLRFWATPENENVWTELQSAGVDLIGTDDLEKLSGFLKESKSDQPPH